MAPQRDATVDIEEIRCPQCNERVAPEASTCFRCQGSLLFDVILDAPISDPKKRFFAAKELAAASPHLAFAGLQNQLQIPGGGIAHKLTRAEAAPILAALVRLGARAHLFRNVVLRDRAKPASSNGRRAVGLLAVLAVACGAWWFTRRTKLPAGSPLPQVLSSTAKPVAVAAPGPGEPVAVAPSGPSKSTRDVAAAATDSTAVVRCANSLGTGFFVTPDKLVTNAHVLCSDGAPPQVELHDGRQLMGSVVKSDERLDLAVVRVLGAAARPLPLGDAATLAPGDKIVLIGTPRGLEFTVHEGTVSFNGRTSYGVSYVQFEGNVNPGNSGGPLLDAQGRVVGVVSMMIKESNGIGLALPINYLYTGEHPMLRPDDAPDESEGWKAQLAKAQEDDDRAVRELTATFEKPALVSASASGRGFDAVVLLKASAAPTTSTNLHFDLRENGRTICQRDVQVTQWIEILDARVQRHDGRFVAWLRSHQLDHDLYGALLRIDLPGCNVAHGTHELVLEGGDPKVNTLSLDE